jgi:hypothetical protein
MKKNKIEFIMGAEWLFKDVMDFEQKEYILLAYIQKIEKLFNDLKLYPTFTELSLHIANIQSLIKDDKMIILNKKINNFDYEITLEDLSYQDKPSLSEKEMEEYKKILNYSLIKFQDYFDIFKSLWTMVYDSIEVNLMSYKKSDSYKNFYYFYSKNGKLYLWRFDINKTSTKQLCNGDEKLIENFIPEKSKEPVFRVTVDNYQDYPHEETLFPLIKRKVMSIITQSKNLTIS